MPNIDDAGHEILFAANIGFLYNELPFPERIMAAARDGFDAVECHWPFELTTSRILDALDEAGIPMIGMNTAPGNRSRGEFGLSALPDIRNFARGAIEQAIQYCSVLGAQNLHVMAGNTDRSKSSGKTYLDNLQYACDLAEAKSITILIEPLNAIDHPAYHLTSTVQAAEVITALNRTNLKLMFDIYHVRRNGDDAIARFRELHDLIGHVQISGHPDRSEPGNRELEFLQLVLQSTPCGGQSWVGAEYRPKAGHAQNGIRWLCDFRHSLGENRRPTAFKQIAGPT